MPESEQYWIAPDQPVSAKIIIFLVTFLFGLTIGWALFHNPKTITVKQTVLVPSTDYAKPYDVCRMGFPFVVTKVEVQGKKDDEITWVTGHPLGQQQTIVCSKDGSYSDVWKPGIVISIESATAT